MTGLMQGYAKEKSELESTVQALEEKRTVLAEDLERTQLRLSEYEGAQAEIAAREHDLHRQRLSLQESIGDEEKGRMNQMFRSDVEFVCSVSLPVLISFNLPLFIICVSVYLL